MYVGTFGADSGNEQFKTLLNQPKAIVDQDSPRLVAQQLTGFLLRNSTINSTTVTPKKRNRINERLIEIFKREPKICEMANKLCILAQQNRRPSARQVEETDGLLCKLQHLCIHETPNQRFRKQIRKFIGLNKSQELNDIQITHHICFLLHEYIKLVDELKLKSIPTATKAGRSRNDLEAKKQVVQADSTKRAKVSSKPSNIEKQTQKVTNKKELLKPKQLKIAARFQKFKPQHWQNSSKKLHTAYNVVVQMPKQGVRAVLNYNSKPTPIKPNLKQFSLSANPRKNVELFYRYEAQGNVLRNSEMDNDSVTEQMQAFKAMKQMKKREAQQRQDRNKRLKDAIDACVQASIKMMYPKISRKCKKIVNCVKEENLQKYGVQGVTIDCKQNGVKLLIPQKRKTYVSIPKSNKKQFTKQDIQYGNYKYTDYLLNSDNRLRPYMLPYPNIDERIGEIISRTTKKKYLSNNRKQQIGFAHPSRDLYKKTYKRSRKISLLTDWEKFF